MHMVHVYGTCIWYMYMEYVCGICISYMYMIMYMPADSVLLRDNFACGALSSGQWRLRRFIAFLDRIFCRNFIDVSTSVLANIYFFHIQSLVLSTGADSPRKSVVDPQQIVEFRAFWLEL